MADFYHPDKPSPWDLRVSAAYLRLLGASQEDAGAAVDRTARCVRYWEEDPSWEDAKQEATNRWLLGSTWAARAAISKGLAAGDLPTARWLLERVDPLFQRNPDYNHHPNNITQNNLIHIGANGNGDDDRPALDPVEHGAAVLRILLEATQGQARLSQGLDPEADEVYPPYTDA